MKFPYQRVLVLGNGGAGKSTFARAMGERFSLPVVHLDRIWWLPGWVNRSREEFDALLARELDAPAWVMDGNYERTLSWRLCYAEAAVFLDLPAEECLKSVRARAEEYRGRTRPDMTEGCEERLDEEFEAWIETYADETRQVEVNIEELREFRRAFPVLEDQDTFKIMKNRNKKR